jgi:hypothetical protein
MTRTFKSFRAAYDDLRMARTIHHQRVMVIWHERGTGWGCFHLHTPREGLPREVVVGEEEAL